MHRQTEARRHSAVAAAQQAGAFIRESFGRPLRVELKGPTDPVTEVDRHCELMIRDSLSQRHPEISFWGEEFGGWRRQESDWFWLVDPLDGTKNFVHGYPFVAVSIALVHHQAVQLGVVYDPLREELFHAIAGGGAFLNGTPIEVSRAQRLEQALVVTTLSAQSPPQKELLWAACSRCQGLRRGGASALDLCQLAAGRLDAMWEWDLSPWDTAAATLLVREAGGTVTRFDGSPFELESRQLLATNTSLQRALVDLLREAGAQ
jgi:myo-inositol-1(or 4)-monophosphatase